MAVAQRLYARALFEAAQDEGRLEQVAADLAAVAGALEVPELGAFLRNPEVEPAGKAGVLEEISEGGDDLVRNFLRLVAEGQGRRDRGDERRARVARRPRPEPPRGRAADAHELSTRRPRRS